MPQRRVYPERRSVCHLHGEDEEYNNVADDHDGEVRRRVVGAVVVQLLTAMGAGIDDFEIAPGHGAFAAGRVFWAAPRSNEVSTGRAPVDLPLCGKLPALSCILVFELGLSGVCGGGAALSLPFTLVASGPALVIVARGALWSRADRAAFAQHLKSKRPCRRDRFDQTHLDRVH